MDCEFCAGGDSCVERHTNMDLLCQLCDTGFYKAFDRCLPCPENFNFGTVIFVLSVLLALLILLARKSFALRLYNLFV